MDTRNKDRPLSEAHTVIADGTESAVEIKPDLEKLRAYKQTKLALAGQLRILCEALKALGRENGERQCAELMVKLAEDRFTLAVVGQFKRGKSSLMNAIIGRELLPTGVLPLTSAITVLKYGPTERLEVCRENSIFPNELPVSALPDYVTEKGNPANEKKVKTVSVELPVPFLRCGIEFVDTPGVGSAITANTATTYDFLPKCDAVLFVTSVDTPMTSIELDFLKEVQEYVDKIFFVVNKIDLMTDNEQREILGFVVETIRSQIGYNNVKIFPISARFGIDARTSGDPILYEQSGLKALEEALASFLSEEKSTAFLAAVAHKALRVLDEEAGQGAFGESALQALVRARQRERPVTFKRDPYAAIVEATSVRAKLKLLHEGILNGQTAGMVDTEDMAIITVQTKSATENAVATPTLAVADIEAGLQIRGCPVCQHIAEYASNFFAHWQYQISIEERAQAEFAAELGFCPLHTWQLLALSSPHGASVGYARLVEQIARRLRENTIAHARGDAVQRLVRNSQNCRICGLLQVAEEEYIRRLAEIIGEASGRNKYRRSQGVCLRHLGMLVNATSQAGNHEFLLLHAAQRFEEDAEDMRSYAMKHEAIRRALQNRNEKDAYLRAIIRIVGGQSVCIPWAGDGEI
jgi:GTPase SAR1 family protein